MQSNAGHIPCETTAVILAGGLGRRMGGRDKGLIPFAGAPLVKSVLRAVLPQVHVVLINSDNEAYQRFHQPMIPDAFPDRPGPLAGLLAGLENTQTEWVLTVPCDTPLLPSDLVARLCRAVLKEHAEVAIAHDGQRAHPVIGLFRRTLAAGLRTYLAQGRRRVGEWVGQQNYVEVDFSDCADAFSNINTPEALRTLEQAQLKKELQFPFPVLGIAAFSGTGKTTLLEQLIPKLKARGLRTALVKHAHHRFDIDKPGKDSYRLRHAGAQQVLIASRHRWALMTELEEKYPEPALPELLQQLDPQRFDMVLVEGFKHERIPKIELHRPKLGKPLLYPRDPEVIALATDSEAPRLCEIPVLDLNDVEALADFVVKFAHEQESLH